MTFQSTAEEMGFFLLAYKIGQVGFSCVSEIRHHVVSYTRIITMQVWLK